MTPGRRIEIGFLIALCVFLPLYEAPKNLAWVGYAAMWLANRARCRDFGGRWDLWDGLLLAWILSGFVVAAFAGVRGGSEWHAAFDIVRYGSVLWMVKRSGLSAAEGRLVVWSLIASALIALVFALAQLWSRGDGRLELNSVGHVNHSAVYLAIMLGVSVAWLFTGLRRVLAAAVCVLFLVALFVGASRAGVVVGLLTLVVLALAWWRRSRVPVVVTVGTLACAIALGALGGAEVLKRHEENVQAGHTLAYRDRAWRLAIDIWRAHPLFGVGMDNFARAPSQQADATRELYPHAHNLYLNALAERGVVGAAPLLAVMVLWPFYLVRLRPHAASADDEWMLWGGALAAWFVTAVAGLVNTTLHHEHGLLAALLLGLWLGRAHRR